VAQRILRGLAGEGVEVDLVVRPAPGDAGAVGERPQPSVPLSKN
jgi:hypothetical protein